MACQKMSRCATDNHVAKHKYSESQQRMLFPKSNPKSLLLKMGQNAIIHTDEKAIKASYGHLNDGTSLRGDQKRIKSLRVNFLLERNGRAQLGVGPLSTISLQ